MADAVGNTSDVFAQPGLEQRPDDYENIRREANRALTALHQCKNPAAKPGPYTCNEAFALHCFADRECQSALWLLDSIVTTVSDHAHVAAIAGGYLVYTLMNKLPGRPLDYEYLKQSPRVGRDEIREAFKDDLMMLFYLIATTFANLESSDIWKCDISPNEPMLRNILWDEVERKWEAFYHQLGSAQY
jgi:hypothetical protein